MKNDTFEVIKGIKNNQWGGIPEGFIKEK